MYILIYHQNCQTQEAHEPEITERFKTKREAVKRGIELNKEKGINVYINWHRKTKTIIFDNQKVKTYKDKT